MLSIRKINIAVIPGAMMMQHLGYTEVHDSIMAAVEQVSREGLCLTRDMGGRASTQDLGQAIAGLVA